MNRTAFVGALRCDEPHSHKAHFIARARVRASECASACDVLAESVLGANCLSGLGVRAFAHLLLREYAMAEIAYSGWNLCASSV